jgi:Mg/Co/Ni transporter MgtE
MWSNVANALRENDVQSAERELSRLELSDKAEEREAATLARAQILISAGRKREAAALLDKLAAHAQSALVRGKASALLAELKKSQP